MLGTLCIVILQSGEVEVLHNVEEWGIMTYTTVDVAENTVIRLCGEVEVLHSMEEGYTDL